MKIMQIGSIMVMDHCGVMGLMQGIKPTLFYLRNTMKSLFYIKTSWILKYEFHEICKPTMYGMLVLGTFDHQEWSKHTIWYLRNRFEWSPGLEDGWMMDFKFTLFLSNFNLKPLISCAAFMSSFCLNMMTIYRRRD